MSPYLNFLTLVRARNLWVLVQVCVKELQFFLYKSIFTNTSLICLGNAYHGGKAFVGHMLGHCHTRSQIPTLPCLGSTLFPEGAALPGRGLESAVTRTVNLFVSSVKSSCF